MKMVSLKLSPEEQMKACHPCGAEPAKPEYPCGLKLYLNEETIAKLGLKDLPAVGQEFVITAKVHVCGNSSHEGDKGLMRSMDLQITEMGLEGMKKDPETITKKLYKS